jgi:peroxiredoxin Q/BCP
MIKTNNKLPKLELLLTNGETVSLQDYQQNPLVIFFYPRANTPGCTQEGKDFRDLYAEFQKYHCQILGASRDGLKAQQNFKNKYEFPFELISDKSETVCKAFNVIKEKSLFGRLGFGVERSTFLFNNQGVLIQEWRKVKVKEHAKIVLNNLKNSI